MVTQWLLNGYSMVTQRLLKGYSKVTQWLLEGYSMVTRRLLNGYSSISSGVTVSGNMVSITLPNTLNGVVPTRIMLTDGNKTVAMELKV